MTLDPTIHTALRALGFVLAVVAYAGSFASGLILQGDRWNRSLLILPATHFAIGLGLGLLVLA